MLYSFYCMDKSLICTTWPKCVYFLLYTIHNRYLYSLRKKFTIHAKRGFIFCHVQVLKCNVSGESRRIVHQVKICQRNSWPTKVFVMFYSGPNSFCFRFTTRKSVCSVIFSPVDHIIRILFEAITLHRLTTINVKVSVVSNVSYKFSRGYSIEQFTITK